MLRIDGRVLAASVVGLFLLGGILGFVAAGSGVALPGTGGDADASPGDGGSSGPAATSTVAPTATPTASAVPPTVTAAGTATGSPTATRAPTPTRTPSPTPTVAPTSTARPVATTAAPTRTPMLIRRFDVERIEAELRRLLNEWREERDRRPFVQSEGNLVADLDRMATNHSVAMADEGATIHEIDDRSSADRYREYDLYRRCWFKSDSGTYFVTPDDSDLEVLGKTYAGRTYRDGAESTDYNANETAVARDIFEGWMDARPYRNRLAYRNASRIGIGIETTRDNEVYVTGAICGGMGDD